MRMLRRTIALALAGLAVAAPPALGSPPHWNSQVKNGAATASRAGDGCTFDASSPKGTLTVSCPRHRSATLTYVFTTQHRPLGTATSAISAYGWAYVSGRVESSGKSLRVTVRVWGSATLNTVSVEYYG
jgi:hypothetical protein